MPLSKFLKTGFRPEKPPAVVNIRRDCYTMSMTDGMDAEIQFYGEIVKTRPIDWWTGEPDPGNFIILDEFLEDLKAISGAKTLLMRIDSIGGDSEVSIVIHNRLRELAAEKTARVDGIAMSGGTHIACAADHVQVRLCTQFMIHKCWSYLWGPYNADELRDEATRFDATDKSQLAIYKRKTNLNDDEILSMMSVTTYLVGQEIIDAGFADELIDGAEEKPEIAASADGRRLYVNGHPMRLSPFAKLPEGIKTITAAQADAINKNLPVETGSNEGGTPMPTNLEELKKENPDLYAQLMAEAQAAAPAAPAASGAPGNQEAVATAVKDAIAAEQKRQKDIDEIAPAINDAKLVKAAKYDEPCTAEQLALKAMQKQAQLGSNHLQNAQEDFTESNAGKVGASAAEPGGDKPLTGQQLMEQGRADAKAMQKKEDK